MKPTVLQIGFGIKRMVLKFRGVAVTAGKDELAYKLDK